MFDTLASPLAGSVVSLEPLAERHLEELRVAASDPRVSTWLPVPLHEPRWFAWWHDDAHSAWTTRRDVTFATVRRADGVAVGSTRFLELREHDRCVEIGWTWLAPSAWGTGANVEAKLLMLGRAFDEAGCIRVELKTDARNERSRAAIAALPAQFEGIHRQHRVLLDGSLRDSAWLQRARSRVAGRAREPAAAADTGEELALTHRSPVSSAATNLPCCEHPLDVLGHDLLDVAKHGAPAGCNVRQTGSSWGRRERERRGNMGARPPGSGRPGVRAAGTAERESTAASHRAGRAQGSRRAQPRSG